LNNFEYCTGEHIEDEAELALVQKIVDIAISVGKFDESLLFRGDDAMV
jgi:ERO1-like protein beta